LLGAATLEEPARAESFIKTWPTFSRPVAVLCDDGRSYVVKGIRSDQPLMPHALTTERAAGLLGRALGAPVPPVRLVDVTMLAGIEPQMAHMTPGVVHGTEMIPDCSDRIGILPPTTDRNRTAYAALAALYGWLQAGDHQLVATLDAAADLYSVDHGHFLPGGPGWSAASLATATLPVPDAQFASHAPPAALQEAGRRLGQIDEPGIAQALGQPAWWGTPLADRVALGRYLAARRAKMIELLGG
jgi:hypothetical protein